MLLLTLVDAKAELKIDALLGRVRLYLGLD
jgi:hypothetical protein